MSKAIGIACAALVALLAGCGQAQTVSGKAAHLTIDGVTHTARPAACTQNQGYRTLDIPDGLPGSDGRVEAVVLLSGDRAIPQWVKIHDVNGFNGSFWQGGVGDARAEVARDAYTISGNAYGINSNNPDKVVTTDFKITADC